MHLMHARPRQAVLHRLSRFYVQFKHKKLHYNMRQIYSSYRIFVERVLDIKVKHTSTVWYDT